MNEQILGVGKPGGLAVVLDYPTNLTFKRRTHLWGDERKLLEAVIAGTGFDPHKVYITFAIKEQVIDKPTVSQIEDAHGLLLEELGKVSPTRILVAGGTAHAVITGGFTPTNIRQVRGLGEDLKIGSKTVYTVYTVPPFYILKTPGLFRDFAGDVEKLKRNSHRLPMPELNKIICQNPEDVQTGLASLYHASIVSCDLETSGLSAAHDQIESIGFGALYKKTSPQDTDGRVLIIPWELLGSEEVKEEVRKFFLDEDHLRRGPVVFHNAKFDLKFLTKWMDTSLLDCNIHDTLIMNYLLDERPIASAISPHGLKNISRVRYDAPAYKFDFDDFWALPKEKREWIKLYDYLALDLYYTARLYKELKEELYIESPKLVELFNTLLMPATKALAEIELRGVKIDKEYLENLRQELSDRKEGIVKEIAVKGTNFGHIPAKFLEDLNLNSYKQVGALLYTYLDLPSPYDRSTDREVLDTLIYRLEHGDLKRPDKDAVVSILESIIEYREIAKILGTYAEGLLERIDKNGYIHGEFNIPGTGTGRLSSSDPNLQNIPQIRGPEIRRAFVPSPGRAWLKADFSQLEYRIAALVCQDPLMIRAFTEGRDIHREVAGAALGIKPEEVDKKQRYAAKFIGFGILYGRGAASIANGPELRGHNWTVKQAQAFIDGFLAQFVGLRAWMSNQQKLVMQEQVLETPLGRKRRWPFLTTKEALDAQRQALNFPIQSTASDFTLTALVKLHRMFKDQGLDTRITLTVHDEIDFDVPLEELKIVVPMVLDVMRNSQPIPVNVPILAEAEVGTSWGSLIAWEESEWAT